MLRALVVLFSALVALSGMAPPTIRMSSAIVGGTVHHVVVVGDTVRGLSARFGVHEAVIAEDNALSSTRRLVVGQVLHLDTRHIVPPEATSARVVVNVPQRHLFLAPVDGAVIAYPIAVGRPDWRTPLGLFTIIEREVDPVWDVPVSIQNEMRRRGQEVKTTVPPGPENPLGRFFIRLSFSGVALHGTTAPGSIYQSGTHGCIRLHPDDIADLFERVEVGTSGESVYEPVLLARTTDGIYLEAHPDVYRRGAATIEQLQRLADDNGLTSAIDWRAVREVLARRTGIARLVSMRPMTT